MAAVGSDLPATVELTVVETEPGPIRTASSVTKPADRDRLVVQSLINEAKNSRGYQTGAYLSARSSLNVRGSNEFHERLLSVLLPPSCAGAVAMPQDQTFPAGSKGSRPSNNAFAVDFNGVAPGRRNFSSRPSISIAFRWRRGRDGTTATQMASTLHFTLTPRSIRHGSLLHA